MLTFLLGQLGDGKMTEVLRVFVFFPQFSQVIPSTARSEQMARTLAAGKSLVMGGQLTCLFSPTSCTLVKSHQLQTG